MPTMHNTPAASVPPRSVWLEKEALLLLLLVLGIYFTRIGEPPLRGEETRWALCSREVLLTGDWVVPHQQGRPHNDRPPLVNWCIALSSWALGNDGALAVRLPSVIATLLVTLLIYGYSRLFLSRTAALASGAAYATMSQVLMMGRLAECESLMTLFVAASLLVWHWGYTRGWPAWLYWTSGYFLAGLAALTKGPQGPIYFVASVGVYLVLVRREGRQLLRPAHLVGVVVILMVVGIWQVPFYRATSWEAVRLIWLHQAAARFDGVHFGPLVKHLLVFPGEVLASMLPWSILLAAFAHRGFRQKLGTAKLHVAFLVTCIAVTFPSVWLAAEARARYFMPLYPCFAPLIGLVLERCWQSELSTFWQGTWKRFAWSVAVLMPVAGGIVLAVSTIPRFESLMFVQTPWFAASYAIAAVALGAAVIWSRPGLSASAAGPRPGVAVLAIAAFVGLSVSGLVVNTLQRQAEDVAAAVANLKRQLPPDPQLVSFGRTHHLFAYHYRDQIPVAAWPPSADTPTATWFCFEQPGTVERTLPFAWEKVAVISCERSRRADPYEKVIVGRRLPNQPVLADRTGNTSSW